MRIRADNTTLEDKILVEANEAVQSVEKLLSSLNGLKTTLSSLSSSTGLSNVNNQIKQTASLSSTLKSGLSSLSSTTKSLLGIGTAVALIRKGINFIKEANTEAVDYAETVNLFNVSMGKVKDQYGNLDTEASKYYIKAIAFQEEMNEKLGTNIEETMNYQALFNSMSKSSGLDNDSAYTISENMTKLGYDLSSLYNSSTETAMEKLQSALSGQTKPLREWGIDITQNTLTYDLEILGIDKSISDMNQAEKVILRYLSILRQTTSAQGDYANTVNSTANQLKIFENQITALKRNIGNLWQSFLNGILPYINAIIMVVNELLKLLAELFGWEVWEQDSISASVGVGDLADDLDTATESAKELKAQLMGFDEINNITTETSSGSSTSGGSNGTGIDQQLLDALTGYDNLMDSISNKATEIRDKILDWLGVTDGTYENLNKILDVVKTVGVALLTWKVTSTITDLMKNLGILNQTQAFQIAFGITLTATGIYAQYKGTQHLLDGDMDIFTLLETFLGTAAGTWGIVNILKGSNLAKNLKLSLGKQIAIGFGIMLSIQGIQTSYDAMKQLIEDTKDAKEAIEELLLGIGETTIAGTTLGIALGGPVGGAIGALTGLVISGTSAWIGYNNKALELSNTISNNIKEYDELKKTIEDNAITQLNEVENTEKLLEELNNLVESNGKVKEGYEARVSYILNELNKAYGTEAKLVDGTIEKYQEFQNEINKLIQKKKAEIVLNAYEEEYTNALKNRATAYSDLEKAEENYKEVKEKETKEILKLEEQLRNTQDANMQKSLEDSIRVSEAKITRAEGDYQTQKKLLENYNQDVYNYETLSTAIITENTELQQEMIDKFTNTVIVDGEKIVLSGEQQLGQLKTQAQDYINIVKEKGSKITEEETSTLNGVLSLLGEKLEEQTKTVEDLTEDNIEAWKILAEGSQEKYNEYISTLPEDVRNIIQEATQEITNQQSSVETASKSIADKIRNGLNTVNSTSIGKNIVLGIATGIKNNINSSTLFKAVSSVVSTVTNNFNNLFGIHSPSRVMAELAGYIPEGISKGIDDNADTTIEPIKKLTRGITNAFEDNLAIPDVISDITEGIKINPSDYQIDTNQFIDYGAISGAIATQSNVKVDSDIESHIENAIARGLSNATIPVEIEATTDEGVIFKKVQVQAKQYKMQTGEPAFDY